MTDQRTALPPRRRATPPAAPASPPGTAPDERATATALAAIRPDLLDAYRAALPGARAAVLTRLWGALTREPVGVQHRERLGGDLLLHFPTGQVLRGPAAAGEPFAAAVPNLTLDGAPVEHPARLVDALPLPGHQTRLAAELDNSVANLALARANATPVHDASLAGAEQSIVDGHPLHPCCRTRIGMSTRDVLAYAPEHRPTVELTLVEVPARRWLAAGTPRPPLLPVHPWQLPVATAAGLRPVGPPIPARPLMSLRTLAIGDGNHVKTAVDVQMTSAVRTVSAAAVHNGPALSGLLAELARRTTDLVPLREFSAATVLVDGEPSRSLAAVWREAPHLKAGEFALPYAALALRPDLVRAHFDRLVSLLLRPVLALLYVGVALEAHGQNALVVCNAAGPVRLLYRDLGGVRVSPRRLAHAGLEAPPLRGDLLDDDPDRLRAKLFAAALSTVVAELVATAGGNREKLWDRVAVIVREAYADLPADARADAVALTTRPWPIKAMTAMRLSGTPLDDVWAYLPNPLAGYR